MSCSRDFPPTNCKQCLIFLLLLLLLFFGTRSAQRRLQNFQRMECNRTKGNYLTLLVIQHCSDLLIFFPFQMNSQDSMVSIACIKGEDGIFLIFRLNEPVEAQSMKDN